MLHYSVDLKLSALQLNQKSTAGFQMEFWEILEKLPSRIILVGCFWKENREGEGRAVTLLVRGFNFFQGSYYPAMRQCTLLETFSHSGSLREKCPNTEFFWVVFSSIRKKSHIWTLFTQWIFSTWIVPSIFIYLGNSLLVQFLLSRF